MDDSITALGLLEDEAITLDSAALELAALDHPGTDLAPYVALLTEMTERLVHLGGEARAAGERATALATLFAEDYGFVGDADRYDDPDNADLIRVIDRRRGLPVSLAILYVAAARRLGWSADVLNTPGHVLARINSPTEPVLIDPFGRGRIVDAAELAALLARMLGPTVVPGAEHLATLTNRAVLVRLLINQASRAETGGRPSRALELYRRMTLIAPGHGPLWWERARLSLGEGDVAGARASLSAMLEVTREPEMRAHIFAALDAISAARP
ncbi:SirB1 family protein [Sphingomonas morindae]|uniref:Transglutaminase-like domain-containing protein n=1 Tax=Sphingomonas morindae TaxID=1541170 RepID=A0ABY4X8Q7_9SPHN|nr:transglutaminase-like domain-containing protein [Sphingomonas morindae]USI73230.1 transglutaminase-like domain-containing protein [Sphingomonas morindae]